MKKLLLTLLVTLSTSSALACSIGINERYITNSFVAQAANEFNIDLVKAKKIKKADFSYQFIGEDPQTLCPESIETQARITITYKKNLTTECELSVTVKETADESVGHLTYEFLLPSSSCKFVPIQVRPIRKPIRRIVR